MAFKLSDEEYDLLLQNDINTKGHTQWYYFSVSNTRANLKVKFNITNLCKSGSLYNLGMKVLIRSQTNDTYFRGGEDISYYSNGIKKNKKGKSYYTMTFTYTFERDDDTVFFAYSMPYTFSYLMNYLKSLEEDPIRKNNFNRRLLTYTLGGNRCDYLTITSASSPEEIKKRKGVVISARVHPGETVGSWMMHGVIDFLTGDSPEAKTLRDNFIFKIIPMFNPDGVINGNYRCNLAGVDLNRRWKEPLKSLHPTIFAAKRLIKAFGKEKEIELICDLHGHSRKHNIFMYGCNISGKPESTRIYPYLLSKISDFFSFKSCCFSVQKSKESTMRVAMFKETRVPHIYTLEASFCGCDFGPFNSYHLSIEAFQKMGKDLCLSIMINNNLKVPDIISEVITKDNAIKFIQNDALSEEDNTYESSSGSDSDPSEDNLDSKENVKLLVAPIKKKRPIKESVTSPPRRDFLNINLPIKTEAYRNKSLQLNKKCPNCGEIEENGQHFCSKHKENSKKHINRIPKPAKTRENSSRRSINLYATMNCFQTLPVYFNHEGKKVRDQYTQTQHVSTPRKIGSLETSTFFLDVNEKSIRLNSSDLKKPEEADKVIEGNRFKNTTYNDKGSLPFLAKGKMMNIEKYLKN